MTHLIKGISILTIIFSSAAGWAEEAAAEETVSSEEAAAAEGETAKESEEGEAKEGEAKEGEAAAGEDEAAAGEDEAAAGEGEAAAGEGEAAAGEGEAAAGEGEAAAGEGEAAAGEGEEKEDEGPPEAIQQFHKGELTRLGSVQLSNQWQAFGIGLGYANIDDIIYAELVPNLSLNIGKFAFGLGAPIRVEMLDTRGFDIWDFDSYGSMADNAGQFRVEDWDQMEDFLRPLRNLSWGRKEDHFYLDLNRINSKTIGHGQLMRRYSPNVDIDEDNLYAAFDAYGDFGGFEFVGGPWPSPSTIGTLFFLKPMGLFSESLMAKSLSVGASYVTDLNAPLVLTKADNGFLLADGSGQLLYDKGYAASGFGVDGEVKVMKTEGTDIKVYGDYSQLVLPASDQSGTTFGDGGFTLGGLFRLNFGSKPVRAMEEESDAVRLQKVGRQMKSVHAMRVRTELRAFGAQYLPSYFNSIYEVQKYQFADQGINSASQPTKVAYLESQADTGMRLGHYLELSYSLIDAIGITVTYEDAVKMEGFEGDVAGRNLAFHMETGGLKWLQIFGTYYLRNFEQISQAFSFSRDNEILYIGGRLAILPILFLNVAAQRAFRVATTTGPDGKIPLETVEHKGANYYMNPTGFTNSWQNSMGIELGFQF